MHLEHILFLKTLSILIKKDILWCMGERHDDKTRNDNDVHLNYEDGIIDVMMLLKSTLWM